MLKEGNMAITRIKTIIPRAELSLGDIRGLKDAAIATGLARAQRRLGLSPEQLIVRQAQNIADFGTALDQWNTAALAVVGTAYSVFQAIAAPALATNKIAVFVGCGVETTPNPVSLLNFRQGAGGGTTYAQFDLERLNNLLEPEGYFSEPVIYEPNEVLNITVTARTATALLARIQLMCYIIEPPGQVISAAA